MMFVASFGKMPRFFFLPCESGTSSFVVPSTEAALLSKLSPENVTRKTIAANCIHLGSFRAEC
jgi:hypothetical protein